MKQWILTKVKKWAETIETLTKFFIQVIRRRLIMDL